MKESTVRKLNDINNDFYKRVEADFDASRKYPWKGWSKILGYIKPTLNKKLRVLDIGCGNGRFAKYLIENLGDEIIYTGIDNNKSLLNITKKELESYEIEYKLHNIDIVSEIINDKLVIDNKYDLVVAFGILHHIPSYNLRKTFIKQLIERSIDKGIIVITNWQFTFQDKCKERIVEPTTLGINEYELELNDYLLKWKRGKEAIRYCHYVSEEEIDEILSKTDNTTLIDKYYSDGKTENLNLYSIIQKK